MTGTWECWQLDPNGRSWVGSVQGAPDIWGDELYDWMTENIEGFDLDQYDCDGDSEHVAVMAKKEGMPDYGWEYRAPCAPVEMVRRPINTGNYL